jgi:hypothetical protein
VTDTHTPETAITAPVLPPAAITHPACGNWWTGLTRAHCPACHRTFSSDSAADKHRTGKFEADRHCADPATVGLVARDKPFGTLWGWPTPMGGYNFRHNAPAI